MHETKAKEYRSRATLRTTDSSPQEYLTTAEAAALLRVKPKTLRNKVVAGVFVEGKHFYRKRGLGPRWNSTALVLWLEGKEAPGPNAFVLAQPGGREVA